MKKDGEYMKDQDTLYKCLECGDQEIIKARDSRTDGRVCKVCKGHLVPLGYVGIDLASGKDMTVWYTPGSKK